MPKAELFQADNFTSIRLILSGSLTMYLVFVLGEMCGFAAHFPQNKNYRFSEKTTKLKITRILNAFMLDYYLFLKHIYSK